MKKMIHKLRDVVISVLMFQSLDFFMQDANLLSNIEEGDVVVEIFLFVFTNSILVMNAVGILVESLQARRTLSSIFRLQKLRSKVFNQIGFALSD